MYFDLFICFVKFPEIALLVSFRIQTSIKLAA